MNKWNKDQAWEFTVDYLRSKFYKGVSFYISGRNKFGHGRITSKKQDFYWLWKKDFFRSFGSIFPFYKKQAFSVSGVGESINIEYLKYCLNTNSRILFCYEHLPRAIYTPSHTKLKVLVGLIYPNGEFSKTPATALLKIYCDHYGLKRTQERENIYNSNEYTDAPIKVNEQTYSFPVALLERLK